MRSGLIVRITPRECHATVSSTTHPHSALPAARRAEYMCFCAQHMRAVLVRQVCDVNAHQAASQTCTCWRKAWSCGCGAHVLALVRLIHLDKLWARREAQRGPLGRIGAAAGSSLRARGRASHPELLCRMPGAHTAASGRLGPQRTRAFAVAARRHGTSLSCVHGRVKSE